MPTLLMIGGPNGAGKTTCARELVPRVMETSEFVNADLIAAGLSPYDPDSVALEAGRLMLKRLEWLSSRKRDFAFESTLAARTFAPFLRKCRDSGYLIRLLYVRLSSPELAVRRVAGRVARGGHHIPADVVHRRYYRGLKNFFSLYMPLADEWDVLDNSETYKPVARRTLNDGIMIHDPEIWSTMRSQCDEQ